MNRIPNSHAHRTARSQGNGQNASQLKHRAPSGGGMDLKKAKGRPARLEGSFAEERRRINLGAADGSLTATEAQQLQAKLDALHGRFQKDAFETRGRRPLGGYGQELRRLQQDTKTAVENDDVDAQKLTRHIDERITAGLADGTLTASETSALRQKAEELKLGQLLAVTPELKRQAVQELRALNTEVSARRSDASFDASKRKGDFEERIAAGLADGSLTERESVALLSRLSRLSDGDAASFDRLSRDLFAQRHDNQVNTAMMSTSLRSRVASLERDGKVTAAQAAELRKAIDAATKRGTTAPAARLNALRDRVAAFAA